MDFEFKNPKTSSPKFIGRTFYEAYKDSEFLRSRENVEMILSRGYELRQDLKEIELGKYKNLKNMCLEKNTPLLVKNTLGPNVVVEDFEFTYNRLTGLTAAYVYENRHRFPAITAYEAAMLGLVWNNEDERACKLYLSAVSGTEHFHQFHFYPLISALKKLELNKITVLPVLKIANIKNDVGETMAITLTKNSQLTNELWRQFGGEKTDLTSMLAIAPPEIKKAFYFINKNTCLVDK